MIQAITGTNFKVYLQTEDNRIDTSVAKTKIKHLFKFTNDMDKSIVYSYAKPEVIENRYTEFDFFYMQLLIFTQGNRFKTCWILEV
jgi:hypothetical protein